MMSNIDNAAATTVAAAVSRTDGDKEVNAAVAPAGAPFEIEDEKKKKLKITIDATETEDDKKKKLNEKAVSLYRYIEVYEETKTLNKQTCLPSFTKPWNSNNDEDQWTLNHYFHKDKAEGNAGGNEKCCGVFLTSYQFDQMLEDVKKSNLAEPKLEIVATPTRNQSSQSSSPDNLYFKLHKPKVKECEMPKDVEDRLRRLQKKMSKNCDTLEQVLNALAPNLYRLTKEDLIKKNLQHVKDYSKSYWDSKLNQAIIKAYKTCHHYSGGAIDKDQYELVLGLGHVRQLYVVNKKKTEEEERKEIVNSPLIEILVDVKYEDDVVSISPIRNTRVKWSIKAKSALVRGGNRTVVSKLNDLVAKADSANIIPGDPSTYGIFLAQASKMCWNGEVRSNNQKSIQAFEDNPDALILNSAWCLFVRRKRSNIRSRDAHAIAEALQGRRMRMSPPLRALVEGLNSSKALASDSEDHLDVSDTTNPLRASSAQATIIRKVLNKRNVVTTVQGPPGTGKTQTAVNIAGCELQNGSRILVTSVNPQSLAAFVEKLPDDIRKFCIDMAEVEREGGGMSKLCQKCDCMKFDFNELAQKSKIYDQNVKNLKRELADMDNKLSELLKKQSEFAQLERNAISQNETKVLAQQMLTANQEMSPFIIAMLPYKDIVSMCENYEALKECQRKETEETIQVVHDKLEDEVNDALIAAVEEKVKEAFSDNTEEDPEDDDWLNDVGGGWDKCLDSVQIGDDKALKSPESAEEWSRVKRHFNLKRLCQEFHMKHVMQIVVGSHLQPESFYVDGEMNEYKTNLRPELSKVLTAELKNISSSDREALKDLLESFVEHRENQQQISNLMQLIQELQTDLASNNIAQQQIKSLTQEDQSHLNSFALCASKLKTDEASKSTKITGKELRKHKDFVTTFHKCLGFMRLLVMTEDQVNTYVPIDKQFDLVIVDEASLSNPTAVTLMPRAKQFVAIGDDKQVSPSDRGFNEDAIDVLEASLPDIESSNQLKPGYSLFDLCSIAFPDVSLLTDHFRCPPDAIAWSNTAIYSDRMKIYKPTTGQQTALRRRVKGKMEKNINEKECQAIVEYVYQEIADTAKNGSIVNSIGIISMAKNYRPQKKRIEDMLDEKLDQICQDYTSKTVDRHNILVGDSGAFQGNERDIMLLSCVHDEKSIRLKPEIDQDSKRVWNVSSTRCTKKVVLFHSFDKKHLKEKKDHKRDIFDLFVEDKGNGNSKREPLLLEQGKQNRNTSGYDLKVQGREKLSQWLKSIGFKVNINRSNVWFGALTVVSGDTCALIHIENYGETLHEWSEVVNDQWNLEGAGTACLRVDTLAVAFAFQSTVEYIVAYLEEAGLQPTIDVRSLPVQTTRGGVSIPVLSDPSESELDSSESSVVVIPKRNKKRKRPVE